MTINQKNLRVGKGNCRRSGRKITAIIVDALFTGNCLTKSHQKIVAFPLSWSSKQSFSILPSLSLVSPTLTITIFLPLPVCSNLSKQFYIFTRDFLSFSIFQTSYPSFFSHSYYFCSSPSLSLALNIVGKEPKEDKKENIIIKV